MHRPAASALDLVHAQAPIAEVTAEPADPGLVRYVAAGWRTSRRPQHRSAENQPHRTAIEFIDHVPDDFLAFRDQVVKANSFLEGDACRSRRSVRSGIDG